MIESALLVGISTFLVTYYVMGLSGPFGIFSKMHDWAMKYRDISKEGIYAHPFFAGLYSCFYCMSTWVCIVITALYVFLIPISILHIVPVYLCGLGINVVLYMVLIPSEE